MKHLLILALLATLVSAAEPTEAPRPNLIIINIDDLGYSDIGPFGSNNRTPELDRMAAEGRKLTSFYAAPVCSPSRAMLMTGSYPKRALPIPHVLFPVAAAGLHPDERTIADVLKNAGYVTACIGKWHLGDQKAFLPRQHGFDRYFGLPYSNDMGPAADGTKTDFGKAPPAAKKATPVKKAPATATATPPPPPDDGTGIKGGNQPPLALLENDTVVARIRAEDQLGLTRRYTERAVAFIRERRNRPYFLYLAHSAVHFPRYPAAEFRGQSPNGLLGDWIQEVDASVGQILAAIRELHAEQNTLVLFVSDNGGPINQGATNRPLRGGKGSTLEGGIRVPALAWWPGRIPAGTSTDAMASMMDVMPTFTRLAGGRLPSDRKLDGVDVWPMLAGDPAKPPRDSFLYFRGLTLEAVRSGPWKLHLATRELYQLTQDIGESANIAGRHPEIVERLQRLADATESDLGREDIGPGCRPLGHVDNPQPLISLNGTVRADAAGKQKLFK